MVTYNILLEELKKVPVDRLQELYTFMYQLQLEAKDKAIKSNPVLSFFGAFSDFSEEDYKDFLSHTKETRDTLFDRNISSI